MVIKAITPPSETIRFPTDAGFRVPVRWYAIDAPRPLLLRHLPDRFWRSPCPHCFPDRDVPYDAQFAIEPVELVRYSLRGGGLVYMGCCVACGSAFRCDVPPPPPGASPTCAAARGSMIPPPLHGPPRESCSISRRADRTR